MLGSYKPTTRCKSVHYYVRISSITFSMDLKDVLPCIKNREIISIIMMASESNFVSKKT
jgi:hypothetical protein